MNDAPHRLPAGSPHGFGGRSIDRKRPIRFRLDGRPIDGFAGDTVLSAGLAAGLVSAGTREGRRIALDQRSAPPVALKGRGPASGAALAMERTPAVDGAEFVTVGPRAGGLRRLAWPFRRATPDGFGLDLGDDGLAPTPWRQAHAGRRVTTDLMVIGGGVAGLAAAAAATPKQRVLLIERQAELGGAARFFGSVEGEETPEEAIARLTGALAGRESIDVMTSAEVFALHGTEALVHRIFIDQGVPRGEVIRVEARRVVLATGALERLPVFPGNRSPGVIGALAAPEHVEQYGVWIGRRAVFASPHSIAYQLALHARDAGVEVQRIADPRISPRSRYVDFCKAFGVPLAGGLAVSRAVRRGPEVEVGFSVAMEGIARDAAPLTTELLIAGGGWQPDLPLWMMAGGGTAWDGPTSRFLPAGRLDRIALAGAVAGLSGTAAAILSGEAAVALLAGRTPAPVVDRQIDAAYESADAPTPIAPGRVADADAYLDAGWSFTTHAAARPPAGARGAQLLSRSVGFSLGDIAAAVELGAVSRAAAGALAGERCVIGGDIVNRAWRVDNPPPPAGVPPPPAYLGGRFGAAPKACILAVDDSRVFGPGCLVFPSSDLTDPSDAIGVVYAPAPGGRSGGLALIGEVPEAIGAVVFVRDGGGPVAARVMERLRAD
jgi:sarcosine oxidase subunit alpha